MNAAIGVTRDSLSWGKAIGLAFATVYVPFVAMAAYTSFFVACSHCKTTVWLWLPTGPGLMGSWYLLQGFRIKTDLMLWSSCTVIDVLILLGLTVMARRNGRWPVAILTAAFIGSSILAILTLMLIRA